MKIQYALKSVVVAAALMTVSAASAGDRYDSSPDGYARGAYDPYSPGAWAPSHPDAADPLYASPNSNPYFNPGLGGRTGARGDDGVSGD